MTLGETTRCKSAQQKHRDVHCCASCTAVLPVTGATNATLARLCLAWHTASPRGLGVLVLPLPKCDGDCIHARTSEGGCADVAVQLQRSAVATSASLRTATW